jgi:hypothetical protein
VETFKMCGWPAWVILLFAIMGIGLAVGGLLLSIAKKPLGGAIVAGVALLVSLGSMGMGPVGAMLGRSMTEDALGSGAIDASQAERIRQAGYEEADGCNKVGLSLGAFPLLASLGSLALAIFLRSKEKG